MSLDDVHIMMFYGSPENVNLTDSIKFITLTFESIVLVHHQEAKTTEFIPCLINFGETSQGRPNCILIPRRSILNKIQSTLLLYYFQSYSPNVLSEILKSQLLLILKVLDKRLVDILKTSSKDVRRVTSLERPQGASLEPHIQMYFNCIIFNFISPNMCLKHQRVVLQLFYSFRLLQKHPKDLL